MKTSSIFIRLRAFGFGNQRVIPSLDGLRAISIAFVLFGHLAQTRNFLQISPNLTLAEFGVRVFFVISGYLITSILLGELNRNGNISLPRFYFRRTMRLFPAAYFFVGVIAVLAAYRLVHLERWDIAFALTYIMDFHNNRAWSVGHLWSLAVEEQFYLVWPLTLKILGPFRSCRFLMGVLVIAPFLRLASPWVDPAFNFFVWSDSLATGCILALLREELANNAIYARILNSRRFFLVPTAAVLANYVPSTKVQWLFCSTIMNVGIAVTMDWAMRNSDGRVGRLLNYPAVSFVGVLSYSLYLWQQPFLNRGSSSPYCAFPLNIALSVAAALASYLLIESPFLRLRSVLERGWSNAHRDRVGAASAIEPQTN
jgi:peptidoglycan/LPS O-acetylase OafA/YrhL